MTSDATSPPDPDDAKAEPSPISSSGAGAEPGAQPDKAAPVDSADKAALDKRAEDASPKAVSPAPPVYRPNYLFLIVVAAISLAADLASKEWAKARLKSINPLDDHPTEFLPKVFFRIVFARNEGGAWGLLRDQPESIRRPFFLGISALAIVFIVSLYRRLTPQQTALKWGLPLVLGGALGNLINRIQYNYVVDFIDIYVKSGGKEHQWPTFNVADIAICVGVGLMAIDMFTSRRPPVEATEQAASHAASKRAAEVDSRATAEEAEEVGSKAPLKQAETTPPKGASEPPSGAQGSDAASSGSTLELDAPEDEAEPAPPEKPREAT